MNFQGNPWLHWNSRCSLNQSDANLKPSWLGRIFLRLRTVDCFTLSFHELFKVRHKWAHCLKRGKTRVTELRLVLVLNLIDWESGFSGAIEHESKAKARKLLEAQEKAGWPSNNRSQFWIYWLRKWLEVFWTN